MVRYKILPQPRTKFSSPFRPCCFQQSAWNYIQNHRFAKTSFLNRLLACYEQDIFPDGWKTARIQPVPKKDPLSNYEPISQLPVRSRVDLLKLLKSTVGKGQWNSTVNIILFSLIFIKLLIEFGIMSSFRNFLLVTLPLNSGLGFPVILQIHTVNHHSSSFYSINVLLDPILFLLQISDLHSWTHYVSFQFSVSTAIVQLETE